jgi:hypothetical protein
MSRFLKDNIYYLVRPLTFGGFQMFDEYTLDMYNEFIITL